MASSSSHSRFQTQPATRLAALPLIAFFDVETSGSKETKDPSSCELLEFGVIIICPASLVEVTSYTTLIRPIDPASARYTGGLTWNSLSRAHLFHEVASTIYMLLHGRVWGGHYIKRFDVLRIREAYHKIGMTPPEPIGIIDTWDLCKDLDFDRRTGNGKLETLGAYFGKDKQTHRHGRKAVHASLWHGRVRKWLRAAWRQPANPPSRPSTDARCCKPTSISGKLAGALGKVLCESSTQISLGQ